MPVDSQKPPPDAPPHCAVLAELWKEVLQLSEPPTGTDNFFALGGDSISMVMLGYRIGEELGIDIAPDEMLGAQTLLELSTLIDAQLKIHQQHGIQPGDSTRLPE